MSKDLAENIDHEIFENFSRELADPANLQKVENKMFGMEQAPCPIKHHFGPGIYIREVSIPAGVFSVGHHQNFEHLNHMVKGRVLMLNCDGTVSEIVAPFIYTSPPGRKIGLILEDMVWQNIYATEETDIEVLEEAYLTKSDDWKANNDMDFDIEYYMRHDDRKDYTHMLEDIGVSHEVALSQAENESDQIPFPPHINHIGVADSPIEGKGLFALSDIEAGSVIAPARINGMRTPAGRYTNHALNPNAEMALKDNGDFDLVAIKDISGCKGGDSGEEITIDYRLAFKLSSGSKPCLASQ